MFYNPYQCNAIPKRPSKLSDVFPFSMSSKFYNVHILALVGPCPSCSVVFFVFCFSSVGCHHPMLHLLLFVMLLRHHSLWECLHSRWSCLTSCPMGTCLSRVLSHLPFLHHQAYGDEWPGHRCSVLTPPRSIWFCTLLLHFGTRA